MILGKLTVSLRAFIIVLFCVILLPCASAKGPTDHEDLFLKVNKCLETKEYDEALKLLNSLPKSEMDVADNTEKLFYNMLYGRTYLLKQDNQKAEHFLDKAISLYEKLQLRYTSYIDMLAFRAYASDALGKRTEAAKWYRKALVKGKTLEHNVDIDNCCYVNLANIYNEAGEYKLASEYYQKVQWKDSVNIVEIHVDHYGKAQERYMQYGKSGNWQKAKEVNDSLTSYCRTKYGVSHDYYLSCLQNEGSIQGRLKDYAKAAIPFEETIRIGKAYSLQSYYVGYAYCRLIEQYCDIDSIDKAISLQSEAIAYIKELNDERISEIESCLFIGLACVRNEGYDAGILALEIFLSHVPPYMQWGVPYAINKLTWAYLNVGKYQEVVDMLDPILSKAKELPDNFQSTIPHFYKTLGCAYYKLKRKEDAISSLKEAIRLSEGELADDNIILDMLKEYDAL